MSDNDQPAVVFGLLLLGVAFALGAGFAWMLRA
jgi:hypothetical protein